MKKTALFALALVAAPAFAQDSATDASGASAAARLAPSTEP